jgi:hypothetical protein
VQGRDQTKSILRKTKGEETPKDSALGQIYSDSLGVARQTSIFCLFLTFRLYFWHSIPFIFLSVCFPFLFLKLFHIPTFCFILFYFVSLRSPFRLFSSFHFAFSLYFFLLPFLYLLCFFNVFLILFWYLLFWFVAYHLSHSSPVFDGVCRYSTQTYTHRDIYI